MSRFVIPARAHGPAMAGWPTSLVVHSAETPLKAGYAKSLAINWFGSAGQATTSAHVFVDPRDVVTMLPDSVVAYHVGYGNRRSKGYEQAGYARFTRAEWLSDDGRAQMALLAAELAADCKRYNIPPRWATTAQLLAGHRGGAPAGITTHDGMRIALGGTTHTDPMPNYPTDILIKLVADLVHGKLIPTSPTLAGGDNLTEDHVFLTRHPTTNKMLLINPAARTQRWIQRPEYELLLAGGTVETKSLAPANRAAVGARVAVLATYRTVTA